MSDKIERERVQEGGFGLGLALLLFVVDHIPNFHLPLWANMALGIVAVTLMAYAVLPRRFGRLSVTPAMVLIFVCAVGLVGGLVVQFWPKKETTPAVQSGGVHALVSPPAPKPLAMALATPVTPPKPSIASAPGSGYRDAGNSRLMRHPKDGVEFSDTSAGLSGETHSAKSHKAAPPRMIPVGPIECDLTGSEGSPLAWGTSPGKPTEIIGFQVRSKNTTQDPVDIEQAEIRSDITNQTIALGYNEGGQPVSVSSRVLLPSAAFILVSRADDFPRMIAERFRVEFGRLTFITKINGKIHELHFSQEEVDSWLDLIERSRRASERQVPGIMGQPSTVPKS